VNVFDLRDRLITDYAESVGSFITLRDERIRAHVDEQLKAGVLWPDFGDYRTKLMIIRCWDAMHRAIETGEPTARSSSHRPPIRAWRTPSCGCPTQIAGDQSRARL
jgi:hypothetical protein